MGSEMARLSDFFYKESKSKKNFFWVGGGGGRGSRISFFFFYKESKSTKKKLWGRGGIWTDRPKPICQFSSSRTTTVQNYFEIHA